MGTLIVFLILFSIFIIMNLLIHKYCMNQHIKVIKQIENEKYTIFKNLKLKQAWNYGFRLNRADLILINKQLIVLIFNSNLNGIIKQAQPVILFYQKEPVQLFNGINSYNKIENIFPLNNGIKILTKVDYFFNKKNLSFEFETTPEQKGQIISCLTDND